MTPKEAIPILNKIGYGYSDRWKETEEGHIEAEGMRLSGPQAIVEAEYWGPLLLNYPEKKENRMSFSTDETNTGVPDLVARCTALEIKEQETFHDYSEAMDLVSHANEECKQLKASLAAKAALLRELAAAGKHILEHKVSESTAGVTFSHSQVAIIRDLLRRADAEAGEEKDDLCPE